MRKRLLAIAAVGLMATATMTACDDSGDTGDAGNDSGTSSGSGKARVGVIFPDTESSTRWANEDPKYLKKALDAAKVPYEMVNAQGDRAKFVQIGESMVNSGVCRSIFWIGTIRWCSASTVSSRRSMGWRRPKGQRYSGNSQSAVHPGE